MLSIFTEWANFLVRWIHLIAGISWIGNSFYFMWMDSSFESLAEAKAGVDGELYMVHGGHFYHVEKQKFRAGFIPKTLHWFKWEATFTWLSGFLLMILLYYATGGIYLIGPESPITDPRIAVLASLGFLFGTWFVYDFFWQTDFAEKNKTTATGISLAAVVGLCFALCRIFTGRGAYLHLGAVFATLMVLNVWVRILPRQQKMFDQAKAGQVPDYSAGPKAKARSTHNSYMTLPVLFAMLSNHFPLAHGHAYGWILLALLCLLGGITRHMMLQWNYGRTGAVYLIPIGVTALLMVALTSPWEHTANTTTAPKYARVQAIMGQRCLTCHSQHPSDATFPAPPNGVSFEDPATVQKFAAKIKERVFTTKTMPLVNRTNITEEERSEIAAWVDAGAIIHD
ncbi:MAG: urate hydroxylase PuuD [Bdellovibrionota bacterium]